MGSSGTGKRKKASHVRAAGQSASRKARRTLLVLHVNDTAEDQVLFQTACKHAKVPFVWHLADSTEKALAYLHMLLKLNRRHAVSWPDLVLLDIALADRGALQVLEYLRATRSLRRLPVVVVTSQDDPRLIRKAQRLGADSYLLKPKQFHATVQLVSLLYATWSKARRRPVPRA
jgi:CheY-like chemotaxis protein